MSNIFVFTSKGSVLIKCELKSDIQWLLNECTKKMASRGLIGPFVEARLEDGSKANETALITDINEEHPV